MPIVLAEGLSKSFRVQSHRPGVLGAIRNLWSTAGRTVEAVADVSFRIEPGEFVGVLGPNGAGKSTTLKMLTGILVPGGGRIEVCGLVPHRDRVRLAARIGVVFGQRTMLWWDLPPSEGFRLLGAIYRIDPAVHARRLGELVERLALRELLDVPVRKLSLGQKMRCELAAALLHAPELLLLDEPTIGLDVVVKHELRAFLRTLVAERSTTVLLTSHDLDDIEKLCHRVIVFDRGRLLHDGDLRSLRVRSGHRRRIELVLRDPTAPIAVPDGAEVTGREGPRVLVEFDAERTPAPDLVRALLASHDVEDLAVQEPRIEDVVKRLYAP